MAVETGKADGIAALELDQIDQRLVDLAREHHERHIDRFLIGHAQAVDELAFLADFPKHIRDLRTAAMYQHDLDTDELQQDDITDDGILEMLGDHGVAAVFDDDDLAAVILNIRQGMYQNSCPLCVRNIHGCFLHYVR